MNVHRLRAVDEIPPRSAVPPIESERRPLPVPVARSWSQIVRLRLWTIAWLVGTAMAVAAIYVFWLPSTYTASTTILVNPPQATVGDPQRGEEAAGVENLIQVLLSAPFAERVVRKLNLERDAEFAGEGQSAGLVGTLLSRLGLRERPTAARPRDGAIDPLVLKRFNSNLAVEVVGQSTVVRVSFSSNRAGKAATVANTIASLYLADQSGAQAAAPVADNGLAGFAEQARYDEQALEQYKATLANFSTPAHAEQPSDRLQQIAAARGKLATEEKKFRQLNTLFDSGGADAVSATLSSRALNELRTNMADIRRRQAELSVRYGERHPDMIALKAEETTIAKKVETEVRRLIQNQAGQVSTARAHVASLEQEQSAAPPPAAPVDDEQLRALEQRAAASLAAYRSALSTSQTKAERPQSEPVRWLEPATTPRSASAPNRPLILGSAFGASVLLALLLAFYLERPKNAFRTGREIEAMAGVANLAVVPLANGSKGSSERVVRKPRSSYAEGIRALYASIQLLRTGQPKVLLITSSVPNEGKTSIAVALARLVARSGARVILVDCDLRHPSVARQLGAQRMDAGLADVLMGRCDLATILRRDPLSPLEFLPVAAPAENSAELIASVALKNLIQVLRLHYDLVVLDAAPVLPVADTPLLSRLADKAIYVTEWNKTPREAVLSGLSILRNAGTEVAGTVLNKTDMRRHGTYGYGLSSQSHRYGDRYYAE